MSKIPAEFWKLPVETIERALEIRKEIETLRDQISGIIHGNPEATNRGKALVKALQPGKIDRRRGKRSAATRAKMRAAAKARWAAKKAAAN